MTFVGPIAPAPTGAQTNQLLPADVAITTNAITPLITTPVLPPGTYLLLGTVVVTGATVAGAVNNLLTNPPSGQQAQASPLWIPDAHTYTVANMNVITLVSPLTLRMSVQADATLAGATAKRLETIGNFYAATSLITIRLY